MSNRIKAFLTGRGYDLPSDDWYAQIEIFRQWYVGYVKDFHHYEVFNGTAKRGVDRFRLNMAKTVCEDHANLLLNEKVTISTGEDDTWLNDIFTANGFRTRANQLIELAYALGTGAFVEYLGKDKLPIIDYIRGDMIFPLSWDNGTITECAFGSVKKFSREKKVYYVQLHYLDGGTYTIENAVLDYDTGAPIKLPDGIEPKIDTKSTLPLFQIVTPNIVNNLDLDCPMGISVFGNAIDEIKGCDLVFDSYMQEFNLGRKRILFPMSMARIKMEQDGTMEPTFDTNDLLFGVFEDSSVDGKQKIEEINMDIRSEQHEAGLTRVLDMLGQKCGLGPGRYKFEGGTVKTATEVISEKSDLYQAMKKNEIPLGEALEGLVRALAFLSGKAVDEVAIGFDDSIIQDSQSVQNDNIAQVGAGLKSKLKAIMEIQNLSEEDAQKELDRIDEENGVKEVDYGDGEGEI